MLINLHTHLEGRVRAHTAWQLARDASLPSAERFATAESWAQALRLDAPGNLTEYLAKVALTYPLMRTPEALFRIACEAVEDAAADGQDYLELRFGPATHASEQLTIDDVIAAVCEGVAEGTRRSGMPAGVVVAALRLDSLDRNTQVARAAARFAGAGVVGFDLAGDELRAPSLVDAVAPFEIAASAGLGLTCHAAEAAGAEAAVDAVQRLGVTRIGHGARAALDAGVMEFLADEGIAVEVCPTSNVYTGAVRSLSEHPALRFVDAGVGIVLGDDNPTQTGSALAREHTVLRDALGLDDQAMRALDERSVDVAFTDDATRAELRRRLAAGAANCA